ncbi:unnamed protein product [Linum tenue]|uniref:Uncharacterized protein n=1 Tax=Linum tenue TaxID=586396 RepID=A0AAV0MKQ2_9ROSI|nr:unnamed protein product [Linum tenue]
MHHHHSQRRARAPSPPAAKRQVAIHCAVLGALSDDQGRRRVEA